MRYNEALQGFPEDALRTATFGREVLNVSEHFFVHGNVPHLTLVLSLGDSPKYENASSYRPRDPNAPNPEDGLTDEQKTCYRALKTWRNETAKAEGWPNCWRLKRARFLRTRRTFARRVKQFEDGALDEKRFAQCAASSDGASRWFGFKGILNDLASKEGSSSGSNRVKRGGSWNNNADNCTSSNRNNTNPSNENTNNGFRLVSTMSEQTGFHFGTPALRGCGDEHAPSRPASSASDRRAGSIFKKGSDT